MAWLRPDLPLDREDAARPLPWLIAIMAYFAVLGIIAALALANAAERWRLALSGQLTISIEGVAIGVAGEENATQLTGLLAAIAAAPGVKEARLIDETEAKSLLSPWLGSNVAALDVPLPAMIAVTLVPDGNLDRRQLAEGIAAIAPGAVIDDHAAWTESTLRFLERLRALAGLIFVLAVAAILLAAIHVARTGLAIHRGLVETVHLLGAADSYIARQFHLQALRLGLLGGYGGALLGVLTAFLIGRMVREDNPPDLLSATAMLTPWQWIIVALFPLVLGVTAMILARLTILRTLARLP